MPSTRKRKNKLGEISAIQCIVRYKGWNETKDFPVEKGRKNYKQVRDEAIIWGRNVEKQIDDGTYKQEHKKRNFLLKEAIEMYINEGLPDLTDKNEKYKNIRKTYLNWFKKEIGYIPIKALSRSDIKQCLDKLKTKNKEVPMKNGEKKVTEEKLTNSTINRYLAHFGAFLSYCVTEYEIIENNVTFGAKLKLRENAPRKRWLNNIEDRVKLLKAMKGFSNEAYLGTLIMLLTGARNDEMAKLTWREVDLENKTIAFKNTKNGSDRIVAIPDILYEALLEFKKEHKVCKIKNDLLFKNSSGNVNKVLFYEKCNEIINNAGFNDDENVIQKEGKLTMYNIRHTFTSIAGLCGVNADVVDKITGHKNGRGSITGNVYTHVGKEAIEIMNRISNYMFTGKIDEQVKLKQVLS